VSQQYESGAILLVRARNGDASGLTAAVVREAQALDANLPPYRVRTLGDRLRDSLAPQRSGATLLGVFGLLALALAAIGLYGVLAYAVGQRRQEFGVRMALGAKGSDVLKLVFRQGAILIIGGVAIGLLIALAVTHALTSLLYEVSAADPLTYAAVTAVLVITALIACYIPARRATKVDPLVALRYE
jgi:putative ABC transport system permease protein